MLVWCFAFGPFMRSVMEGDRPPQLRRYPSVLDMGKMTAVEYEGEAGVLSPTTDSEDSFDCRHAQHHQDVRFSERALLDSHSRWRRVSRALSSPAGDRKIVAQRERTCPDDTDACWSPLGAGLRIRSSQAHFALSRSHRASGSRSSRDGGHLQEG